MLQTPGYAVSPLAGGKFMKSRTLFSIFGTLSVFLILLPDFWNSQVATRTEQEPRTVVTAVLTAQQGAWNRGDLVSFLKGYWDSPELTFSGSNGITRGYNLVLARYQQIYPDQKAMGHLDFSDLEVRALGKDAALVLGRWHLKRVSDELGGNFTLVFERFPDGWKIIHDHTSADAQKP
jgi:ketosteroid isomerase-like protein